MKYYLQNINLKIVLVLLFLFKSGIAISQDTNYIKGLKAFDNKEFDKAIEYLQPYADNEDCVAQYALGFIYSNEKLSMANDSLAEIYLLKSSNQKHTHAMGLLATLYFKKSYSDKKYNVKALVWAELAAEYDVIQKGLTTRYLIRSYMTEQEIEEAEKILKKRKKVFDKKSTCS